MNEQNFLENQFRSWTPRSPSAKLKARLFPESESLLAEPFSAFGGRWAWLGPVMGCCLILMVLTGSRSNQLGCVSAARTTNWLATVASNQSYAAYIVAGFHSEQNSLQQDPIEWTNGARLSDEPGSLPHLATNFLIR